MQTTSPTRMASAVGISVSYASEIIRGIRPPSRSLAIRIFEKTGMKYGPVSHLDDSDVEILARLEPKEPANLPTEGEAA